MRCAVSNCGNNNRNNNRKKWRYFHFPKDQHQLQKWIEFCDRKITNTATACICNEHFTPEDFERNMQYELGFTRKNPTKLKPDSNPTIRRPLHKLVKSEATVKRRRAKKNEALTKKPHISKEEQVPETESSTKSALNTETENTVKFEIHQCTDDFQDIADSSSSQEQSYEMIEYISETEEYANSQLNDNVPYVDIEIIDPLNPQANAEDHVEIIDSESDNYARHLESEVSKLKRQVFFLKDERKKMINEIQYLRETVRNTRLKGADTLENRKTTNFRHRPQS